MVLGGAGIGAQQRRRRRLRGSGGDGGAAAAAAAAGRDPPSAPPLTAYDVSYFNAYANLEVHEEMLKDRVRTESYRSAIMQHQKFITDKVVIDVGCGTGVLSIFCARAGARRVYAVDASLIANQAKQVVEDNNLSDKVIVLHGRIEDVEIEETVDVIISEWMGYMLVYESMLESVIFARDKWLKPGGLILPSHASLYMAPVTNSERYHQSIDFWHNVYGIKMSALIPFAKLTAFEEPSVETIKGENVLTWPSLVTEVDCYTVRVQELKTITAKYEFSSMLQAPLHGFAFWFDVEFNGPELPVLNYYYNQLTSGSLSQDQHPHSSGHLRKRPKSEEAVILSTAPEDAPTHWQQTLVYMFDPIQLEEGQIVEGSVTISQREEHSRFLNIRLEFNSGGRSFEKVSVLR
ncbi:probable protein arginine N-methyltransferase 6.2 isoform X2 [Ananas comosus]|uniref:Probable protein arginine N-methyltransferase 6.2 isoform X2 n=1 Tax=Ananas comosus TaxID=4615 RepID=A0A6P5FFB4_ANACO|nr:probable protein arginine N-methyltransferase 6.2 isoform X2 [Ananas comosus]